MIYYKVNIMKMMDDPLLKKKLFNKIILKYFCLTFPNGGLNPGLLRGRREWIPYTNLDVMINHMEDEDSNIWYFKSGHRMF